jgi:hypothetical protein
MARPAEYSKELILETIEKHDGFLTMADLSRALGCGYSTIKERVEKDKDLYFAFHLKSEQALDDVEKKAYDMAVESENMVKYLLSTKGKNRGYSLPTASINQTTNVLNAAYDATRDYQNEQNGVVTYTAVRGLNGSIVITETQLSTISIFRASKIEGEKTFVLVTVSNDITDIELQSLDLGFDFPLQLEGVLSSGL